MKTSPTLDATNTSNTQLAYSPRAFAALFGKHYTWAYRQMYKGNIKAITSFGRTMIPRSEADRLVQTAHEYSGAQPGDD